MAAASAGCLSPRDSRDNATVVETGHIILLGSSHLGDVLGNASWCLRVRILCASPTPSTTAASVAMTSPLLPSMSLLEAPWCLLKPSILLLRDVDIGYWGCWEICNVQKISGDRQMTCRRVQNPEEENAETKGERGRVEPSLLAFNLGVQCYILNMDKSMSIQH